LIEDVQTREELRLTPVKSMRSTNRRGLAHALDRRKILGFTMLEMMIVMAIIAILLSIAIPTYSRSILAARERALRADLTSLRQAIWKYTLDKQTGPQSLDDLRAAGYISKIPDDPMTHEPNWEVVQEDVLLSIDQQDPGITDVHSASNGIASDGTTYSTW
jgi:general secretion pathway protein G